MGTLYNVGGAYLANFDKVNERKKSSVIEKIGRNYTSSKKVFKNEILLSLNELSFHRIKKTKKLINVYLYKSL